MSRGQRAALPADWEPLLEADLGPCPVGHINKALDLDLEPGTAHFSERAQRHVAQKRPGDYNSYAAKIANVISNPIYVRDDFANADNIELIGYVGGDVEFLLVAIRKAADDNGNYGIASFYPVSRKKVDTRLEAGQLKRVIKT